MDTTKSINLEDPHCLHDVAMVILIDLRSLPSLRNPRVLTAGDMVMTHHLHLARNHDLDLPQATRVDVHFPVPDVPEGLSEALVERCSEVYRAISSGVELRPSGIRVIFKSRKESPGFRKYWWIPLDEWAVIDQACLEPELAVASPEDCVLNCARSATSFGLVDVPSEPVDQRQKAALEAVQLATFFKPIFIAKKARSQRLTEFDESSRRAAINAAANSDSDASQDSAGSQRRASSTPALVLPVHCAVHSIIVLIMLGIVLGVLVGIWLGMVIVFAIMMRE
ncbi:hypothetical protein BDW74DRAFT_183577 [Aspergillus multicolor]|uniref:uncharacterized protein n=1 Tax=Aspergillus multicolor TaxID=41759 RepID=UPI003CCD064E